MPTNSAWTADETGGSRAKQLLARARVIPSAAAAAQRAESSREIAGRLTEIRGRMDHIRTYDKPTQKQIEEHDALVQEERDLVHVLQLNRVALAASAGRSVPAVDPTDRARAGELTNEPEEGRMSHEPTQSERVLNRYSPTGRRDSAMRALDESVQRLGMQARAAETAERLLNTRNTVEQDMAVRYVTAVGNEHYFRAWSKVAADPRDGHRLFTQAEADAFREADLLRAAWSESPGGYLVPLAIDPALVMTAGGSIDPMRALSRVQVTGAAEHAFVTSAGVTASWDAELAEVSDDTPTVADKKIKVHRGSAYVEASFEVLQDSAQDVAQELQKLLVDAKAEHEAGAFMTGTGSGQPKGILTAVAAAQKLPTATADTIVAADLTGLQAKLAPRWQAGATFVANLDTINTIGSLETTNGNLRFPEVADGRLLRRPLVEASGLDSRTTTVGAGDDVVLYGDFKQFVIVDRLGTTIDFIPYVTGANRRPIAARGWFMNWRVGSDLLVPGAMTLLTA